MRGYFQDKEPRELRNRVPVVNILAAAAVFILAVRFWHLQVMESSYYSELSLNNRIRLMKSMAPRGLVYDRSGFRVVENRPGFDLLLVPEDVTDWAKTADALGGLVGITPGEIAEKIEASKGRPPFRPVRLKEDMSWEETVKVEAYRFEMPGVMLDVSPKRSYIYGEAFAHLMGYLGEISEKALKDRSGSGLAMGDIVGKFGLEKSLDRELRGVDGGRELEVDALGRRIRVVRSIAPTPGNVVRLTIDLKAQIAAYEALKGKAGAAIAVEPSTGRILALVSTPGFDPNKLSSGITKDEWNSLINDPMDILTNRATQGQYPPASTFKPIAAVAALEEKVITPGTFIFSGPSFWFGGREYRDWKEEGHGHINVHRAVVESSDTFFYQVGLKLGVDTLARYSSIFGFGKPTGVELVSEKAGLVPSSEWKQRAYGVRWYEGETISVSVGQGYMLVTPLQLAMAYAAIANGGTIYRPQLVEEILTASGESIEKFSPEKRSSLPISPATLSTVKGALKGVIHEDGGTAHFLKASGLKIAGKTGTAQVAKLIKRTKDVESIPYKYRDHAWFAGFAPYDDPKIAVAVIVEHGGFGASAAAPVAREIFKAYLAPPADPGGPLMVKKVSSPEGEKEAIEAYD